ncbi:MAG: double ATPase transporter [Agromyces sp.]|jgi:ATP-binding cassette subfamily C protein|nr:double ATPase transporter [Agromyces sp.]
MIAAVRSSFRFMTVRERVTYLALLIARTLSGLLDVLGVFLIGLIASLGTTVIADDSGSTAEPIRVGSIELPPIGLDDVPMLAAIVLVVFVGKSVLAVLLSRKLAFFVASIEARNALIIAEHLMYGSLDDIRRHSKAEFQFAVVGSTTAAFGGLLNTFAIIVSESFLLILISVSFLVVDPIAAIFALVYFAAIGVLIQSFMGRSLKRAGEAVAQGTVDTTNIISDSMDTFREVSVMAKQPFFLRKLSDARNQVAGSGATAAFMSGLPRYIIETALIVGVVALVAQQFITNGLGEGIVVIGVFLTGGMRIMASLLPLQNSVALVRLYTGQATLAHSLLSEYHASRTIPVPISDPSGEQASALPGGLSVSIAGASFAYPGDTRRALDDVSVEAASGRFVAIIGPSGSGKTTLVDLLLGLLAPDSGDVRIGDRSPHDLRVASPGVVSYVPQRPGMVAGTIAENIALGVDSEHIDRERLQEVIDAAFLADFIESLPEGADTSVGKQSNSLSGGQIQRIGLARALYTRPRLLIMDEATSALDAGSEAFISESLARLHGEVTVIVIAHRLSTVQHADHVYLMDNGRVVAQGTFKHLMRNNPMVAEYVRLMSFDDQKDEAQS